MRLDPHDGLGIFSSPSYVEARGSSFPTGRTGDILQQLDDGAATNPLPAWGDPVPNQRVCAWWQNKGLVGSGSGWVSVVSGGSGSATRQTRADATHGALLYLKSGTATTNAQGMILTNASSANIIWSAASHLWRYEAVFRIPVLSDGTDTFRVGMGFCTAVNVIDQVDGAYILINSLVTNAQCVTAKASTRTTTDSGFAIALNTFYRIAIVAKNVSTVDYYLSLASDPNPSTPTVTISTNVPTAGIQAGFWAGKTAGTTSREYEYAYQQVCWDRVGA